MDALPAPIEVLPPDAPVGPPAIAPQASSDEDMVSLWLATYHSRHTQSAYAADLRAFRTCWPNRCAR